MFVGVSRFRHTWVAVLLCVVLAGLASLVSPSTFAQIYRWVDEEGNVHFSDKPVGDNKGGAKSETVELQRGYTPSTLSPEEARDAQLLRLQQERANSERRNAEAKLSQEREAERREKRQAQCERDRETLRKVTEVTVRDNGEREITILTDENGKPMSVSAQNEAVARLREKIARDC